MADSFNNFSQIADAFPKLTSQMVRKTALDAKANIQAHIVANDQVDKGFMLNSVYTVTDEGTDYQGGEKALPQVEAPADDQTAYVAVAAEYACFQNYGTVHMTGRPFFEPGMEAAQNSLDAAMQAIAHQLERSI